MDSERSCRFWGAFRAFWATLRCDFGADSGVFGAAHPLQHFDEAQGLLQHPKVAPGHQLQRGGGEGGE